MRRLPHHLTDAQQEALKLLRTRADGQHRAPVSADGINARTLTILERKHMIERHNGGTVALTSEGAARAAEAARTFAIPRRELPYEMREL